MWWSCNTHYSKSHIFVQKSNFDKTPTFSRVFHPKFFWQFFSYNQSCQQLKSPKPRLFHEFFTQKIDNFLRKSKLNFWTKNEDFEQCVILTKLEAQNAICIACQIKKISWASFYVVKKNWPRPGKISPESGKAVAATLFPPALLIKNNLLLSSSSSIFLSNMLQDVEDA